MTNSSAAGSGAPRAVLSEIDALPAGKRLAEFEILRVLGMGGFGIVYLALDTQLQRQVALKEYLPASMAGRTEAGNVTVRSRLYAEPFSMGLRSFVNEARLLARFDNPSLVKVHRFWEANGTAYMVMPYYDGATLKAVRQSMNSPPDEAWLRRVLDSLLGALEVMHAASVYHRDVAPDNILLLRSGQPVLLDFGAARHVLMGQTQTLTAMLKPAYAPIEQYAEASEFRQGPWTDIYATAATLHYCLTGRAPPTAAARAVHDSYEPLRLREDLKNPAIGRACDPAWLAALDWGLEVKPQARPQSVAQWREVLAGRAPIPVTLSLPEPVVEAATAAQPAQPKPSATGAPATPAASAAAKPRPRPRRLTFREALPWALWVLSAIVVAGVALYFRYTGEPPPPSLSGFGFQSNAPAALPVDPMAQPRIASGPVPAATSGPAPGARPGSIEEPPAPPAPMASSIPPVLAATPGAAASAAPPLRASAASAAPVAGTASTQDVHSAARPSSHGSEAPAAAAPRRAVPGEPAAEGSGPRAACSGRLQSSLDSCMRSNCRSSFWSKHPDCVAWRQSDPSRR